MNNTRFARHYLFPLLLLINSQIASQNSGPLDSLMLKSYDTLHDKYYEYKFTDSLQAKKYANVFLKKAKKEKIL